ncbi:HalOD1 output domain-containing protein [Natronolimnohabitans sp. A-GB9]|uniref:HalOD1 output domain-containing protein n=1 Tax=Natronolimnohabitans sp. A-GB9 TaxID=3069757 RepID=UPI0027B160F8|nr:HalOD1 output domain-containing protein [Natronolimnohabitans sp. A-GB9]MDQ2050126.1 HalOD1 output domain-containing protein [Natronolimnohabitans sp. A-GB9]
MTERRISESPGCEFERRIQYERATDEPPSIATAMALAQYFDDDVEATSVRLYDYVDPDALDALFAETNRGASRTTGTVEFQVEDATVRVTPDRVEVSPNNG